MLSDLSSLASIPIVGPVLGGIAAAAALASGFAAVAKIKATQYQSDNVPGSANTQQAETSAQYLKKGQGVMIEGRIQTRSWDDQATGAKKYRTEIVAESVQFGSKLGGGDSVSKDESESKPSPANDLDTIDYGDANVNVDDIPF